MISAPIFFWISMDSFGPRNIFKPSKGDLKIAISTNGKSPTLAKRLKEIFNEELKNSDLQMMLDNLNEFRNHLKGDFANKVKQLNEITSILTDKNKKGEIPSIISDNTFFLQHINDTSYRVSKSNVKECIKTTFKSIGLGNILMAQTLLNISQDFRNHINKFCPIIYKNWSKKSKVAHQKFENEMQELINIIDLSILGLKKSQEKMNETKNFNKK